VFSFFFGGSEWKSAGNRGKNPRAQYYNPFFTEIQQKTAPKPFVSGLFWKIIVSKGGTLSLSVPGG